MALRSLGVLLALCLALAGQAEARELRDALVEQTAAIAEGRSMRIDGVTLARPALVARFYAGREHRPLWNDPARLAGLLRATAAVEQDGLRPDDYQPRQIAALAAAVDGDPERAARLELLATDALARLATHLRHGKTDPRAFDADWNISAPRTDDDALALLAGTAEAPDPAAAVAALAPDHWFYGQLRKALALQRAAASAGGWGTVAPGDTLKPGMTDPRVAALRARLAASGDHAAAPPDDPNLYDPALESSVKRFQTLHGIDPDGAVGRRTLAELNVGPERRADQVRVNLERARWVLNDLGPQFIIVNIPGFHLYVVEDGVPVWTTRVVVGRAYRQTPMFKSTMRSIVLNPTWTVPPTILREDVLPKLAKDPSYLTAQNMRVVDANGTVLDPASIDWSQARRRFPYALVQQPGAQNALGRIKFQFPNEHAVYLHDTPNKAIFERADRAASSGCIRVENPMALAEYLLAGDPDWPRSKVDAAIETGRTQSVVLKRRVPIVLMYWTAQMDRDGTMHFYPDLYDRDPPVLRALDR
jgi:murein L,D-transpeptidase YcbB/YkuD